MASGLEVDLSGFGLERVSYIGKGQFACCQLVREIATFQLFVAKCVKLGSLSESYQALAHQEVFLLEALSHPFVVAYHDSFLLEHQNVLIILMEHCEGGDLRNLIAEKAAAGTQLPESQIMTWFAQLILALQYVHGEKVLHRDLKCSNIFLVNGGSVLKVGDFGISRILESQEVAMTLVGTPYYLSPEVCSNETYSWKSDLWSLGCVLYELCTFKHAFEHTTLQGLVHKIKSGNYEPIPDLYSKELHDLIRQLLTTSVDLRPSVDDVIAQPFVQSYIAQQVPFKQPSIDLDARNRSKDLRPSSAGLLRPGSATTKENVPPMPVLGPEDMSLVLASRINSRLAEQGLSLSTEYMSLDDAGVGVFLPGALRKTLQNLGLSFSEGELTVFEASLPRSCGAIKVSSFEAKLAAATASPKIQDLWAWARLVLRAPMSKVSMSMQARDLKGLHMLSPSDFEAALKEVAPHASSEHLARLMLMADKNEFGYIKYMQCIGKFSTASSLHEDSFFTCASRDLQVIGAKHEAWDDLDPDPDEAWD